MYIVAKTFLIGFCVYMQGPAYLILMYRLDTVQDVLINLDIKPRTYIPMDLLEIRIFFTISCHCQFV